MFIRNRQNEVIEIYHLTYQGNWREELKNFLGEDILQMDANSVEIKINGKWRHISGETYLIKTAEGIRLVPDYELIGDKL